MKNVKMILASLLVGTLILISGCSQNQLIDDGGVEVPNPASLYCVDVKGGSLDIQTNSDGEQIGICTLPDGTQIEEWELYNQENKESLICTREYMPVCAKTSTDDNGLPVLETFSNKCMAQDNQIIHQGVCGDDSWQAAQDRICTMEYAPVCANFNGEPKTFGNSCGAQGLEIISQGEC